MQSRCNNSEVFRSVKMFLISYSVNRNTFLLSKKCNTSRWWIKKWKKLSFGVFKKKYYWKLETLNKIRVWKSLENKWMDGFWTEPLYTALSTVITNELTLLKKWLNVPKLKKCPCLNCHFFGNGLLVFIRKAHGAQDWQRHKNHGRDLC